MTDIVKFPSTPHLAWLSSEPVRRDKVFSPVEAADFLRAEVTMEEKVDGANLGIAFSQDGSPIVQNRGTILGRGAHAQFGPLWQWLSARQTALGQKLETRLVLFGEWCFVRHSCPYNRLPDWFLAFDVYDRESRAFWSVERRDALCQALGVQVVPKLGKGHVSLSEVTRIVLDARSALGPEHIEGVYLRSDRGAELRARAKLVRPEFAQAIEHHWQDRPLERNKLAGG